MTPRQSTSTPVSPTDLPIFALPVDGNRPAARSLAGAAPAAGPLRAEPSPHRANGHSTLSAVHAAPVVEDLSSLLPHEHPVGVDDGIDYRTVRVLRGAVTEVFHRDYPGQTMTAHEHSTLIDDIIDAQIQDHSTREVAAGRGAIGAAARASLRRAVRDSLFGVGRIQPLLDLEGLENIEIEGCDNVWLEFADGTLRRGPAVADSDAELIADIQQIARSSATGEREFSQAKKKLRMALPDGSRLAAEAWLCDRPSMTIRKHRFVDTDLPQMRALGAVDAGIEAFLAAAIRAGKSMVISGLPASGKTTLVRAILAALDPQVRLATVETNYELYLHHMPSRHYRVWPAEAQEGGEPGPDGQPIGRVSVVQLIEMALQKNTDRIVVGEVVGPEILAMLEAMQAGKGSVSTMHANNAWDTVERIVTFITRERGNVGTTFAQRLVAQNVNLIVHLGVVDESHLEGGRKHRFVDEILALDIKSDEDPVEREYLWTPGEDRRAEPTGRAPKWLDDLVSHGFDPNWLQKGYSTWAQPLDLVRARGHGRQP